MKVKAYGKILIFGSYSILEKGNIGLVANIDKGCLAIAKKSNALMISSPKIKDLSFIKNAARLAYDYVKKKTKPIFLEISCINDAELGSKKKTGFGSSAASTVAVVAAILNFHNIDDREIAYEIAKKSHYLTQGSGSGFDVSACCFGSHFFINSGKRIMFSWPDSLNAIIAFTGKPASTKNLVSKVMEFKQKNPKKYFDFMNQYNKINNECRDAFLENDIKKIFYKLEESWHLRKILGKMSGADIEPEHITKLIKELKKNGAYSAGLLGAGGGDSLIVFCRDKKKSVEFLEKKGLQIIKAGICSRKYEVF